MKHAVFLLVLLFFSFFCETFCLSDAASRCMARIKNNLDRRIAGSEYNEHRSYAEQRNGSGVFSQILESNKPSFCVPENNGEAYHAVSTLGTFMLGFCVAYASVKRQAPEPPITQSLSEEELFHQMIQQNYAQELIDKNALIAAVKQHYALCSDYGFSKEHLEGRLKALDSIDCDKLRYDCKRHHLSTSVSNLLGHYGLNKNLYSTCYGNQLQQELHEECLSILENTAALSISCALYDYKPELVGLANGAREYNQQGLSRKAIIVLDVCWSLFDYGTAIAE